MSDLYYLFTGSHKDFKNSSSEYEGISKENTVRIKTLENFNDDIDQSQKNYSTSSTASLGM